jgi:glycosyltransferase involved in cell wall biosynthesis
MEAMATGLPVVAGARGGYNERLRHGVDALQFHCTDEAIEHVMALAHNRDEALRIGAHARRRAVALNADELPRRTIELMTGRRGAQADSSPDSRSGAAHLPTTLSATDTP